MRELRVRIQRGHINGLKIVEITFGAVHLFQPGRLCLIIPFVVALFAPKLCQEFRTVLDFLFETSFQPVIEDLRRLFC